MLEQKLEMFANRLAKVFKHYTKWAQKQNIACYRFYDHDMPEFPLVLEKYGDVIHGAEYRRKHGMEDEEHERWLQACKEVIGSVCQLETDQIFIKERKRITHRPAQYSKFEAQKKEKIVTEHQLSFIINLTDYLDTGLFLDHRITRALFQEEAAGKRVLNLFCYTGAFSVYAAAGKASTITSVDMSATYIHWAKRNMQYNKLFQPDRHFFIQDDVLQWLKQDTGTYDLVICDPPTFSNSKRMEENFDVQSQHVALLNGILQKMSAGGVLYFSNNYRDFVLDEAALQATSIKNITNATLPFDFKDKLKRVCFKITK